MSWADALEEFEQITICHLDGDDEVERRCIGIELNSDEGDLNKVCSICRPL